MFELVKILNFDTLFKWIFFQRNLFILIDISLKIVAEGWIENKSPSV